MACVKTQSMFIMSMEISDMVGRPLCVAFNYDFSFYTGTCLFIVLFILSIVFAVVMGFSIVSWWIGDLTIFANNERMSGNGCFLRPNL